ncbi:MAG: NMDA receptor-regulated protein 1-domain-containing protein [Piptocephalis tieghemiana]|nr:MAG: NMDA receptor-regulated protein 1-domain-containing protein [Piptocephalis tieghemiana]
MSTSALQALPLRDQQIFKSLLRSFELQHYKKGLKASEQILRKFPEHGETLAMKGIFLVNMDRKEEGYECVRKGLRNDLKSYICWHVYGLIHRKYQDYEEAIKCYRNALRFEKNNIQIQRDLSILLMQERQLEGYTEAREDLLALSAHQRAFWVGWIISLHLVKEYDLAIAAIDAFDQAHQTPPARTDFEHSELLLYRNLILEESGDIQGALAHLDAIEKRVCDLQTIYEKRASFHLRLGHYPEAIKAYGLLFERNPDCKDHLIGYLSAKASTSPGEPLDATMVVKGCKELLETHPRSDLLRRFPLTYASGEEFKSLVDAYLKNGFRKGIPSLFISLKNLYGDEHKVKVIQELVQSYIMSLSKKDGKVTFPGESTGPAEVPTTLLWALYYQALHEDKLCRYGKALEVIDQAIAHTPTLVDLYMVRARILKHMGNITGAADVMEEARLLDLQDRYINTKSAKYALRAGRVTEAVGIVGLFTRKGVAPEADLEDLQCNWWSLERARAWKAEGAFSKAIPHYRLVLQYFSVYWEDQLDFHSYAVRRSTLRDYVRMLQFEDTLHSHPFYQAAAQELMECFLAMNQASKAGGSSDGMGEEDTSNMSASELKKYRNKQRKAELKAKQQREEEEKKKGSKKKGGDTGASAALNGKKGADGSGSKPVVVATTKEVTVEKPLEEGIKVWKQLRKHCPTDQIPSQLFALAAQFYELQGRFVLAAKCLAEGFVSASDSSLLQGQAASLYLTIEDQGPEEVRNVVREVCNRVLKDVSPKDIPAALEAEASKEAGVQDLVRASQLRIQLGESPANVANALVKKASALLGPSPLYKDALVVKDYLVRSLRVKEATAEWNKQCTTLLPQATSFAS